MSRQQPVTQVRLTNIAIVRYKTKGFRFEIACFPNKVLDYRKKIEKDLHNVIQSDSIFSNVGKGQFARRDDVMAAFGTLDINTIINIILEKGDLQVSEKERAAEIATKTKEIVNIVSGMCINSETKQPISSRVIEQALKESSFQINLQIPIKSQAMKVFRLLSQTLPIERVKMKVLISTPAQHTKTIKVLLSTYNQPDKNYNIIISNITQTQHSIEFTLIIDPGYLREITDDIKYKTNGQGDVSVVDMQVERDDLITATDNQLDGDDINDLISDIPDSDTKLAIANINNVNDNIDITTSAISAPSKLTNPSCHHPQFRLNPVPTPAHVVQQNYGQDDGDDDDDITAILNRNITVLREEDEIATGATIITSTAAAASAGFDFNKFLDEYDEEHIIAHPFGASVEENDVDEETRAYRQDLKQQYSASNTLHFASNAQGEDDYEYLSDDEEPHHTAHGSAQTQSNTDINSFSHYLITNPPTTVKTLDQNGNEHAQYISKYDKRRTLYKDFMHTFNNDGEYNKLPIYKQDLETLDAIKRQTLLQSQNDTYEWIFELPEDTASA